MAETRLVQVEDLNMLMPDLMEEGRYLWGRIRSNAKLIECVVNRREGQCAVLFAEPVFAPAPGQRLVLYDEAENLVAGGTIRPLSYGTFIEGRWGNITGLPAPPPGNAPASS
jgi:tRNA-specific 2-thiouridylase